jgi:hypothetical protein
MMYIKDEESVKKSIRGILEKKRCPDCTYPNIDGEKEIDLTVNKLMLLFSAMLRNERLGIK